MKNLRLLAAGALLALGPLTLAGCAGSDGDGASSLSNKSSATGKTSGKVAKVGSVLRVRTTAYNHRESDHIAYGKKNALGTELQEKGIISAAADWSRFPCGTKFKIMETNETYVIDDYGSALVGTNTIDLYRASIGSMNDWGVRNVRIKILKVGSYKESLRILAERAKYAHCANMVTSLKKQIARRQRLVASNTTSRPEVGFKLSMNTGEHD